MNYRHQLATVVSSGYRPVFPPLSIRHYFREILDAVSEHPIIVATVTGGSGLVAAIYRTTQLSKMVATATRDNSIMLLPPKPSHELQSRSDEMQSLSKKIKRLRKTNRSTLTQGVYITGRPGMGKTQLARELGKVYFDKNKGFFFCKQFVGTLDMTSLSSLTHSYINIAMELGCVDEIKTLQDLVGQSGEVQGLEILSSAVKKHLRQRKGWMLIVDNLSGQSTLSGKTVDTSSVTAPELSSTTFNESVLSFGSTPLSVGLLHGISRHAPRWSQYWPQPGDEDWGRGFVVMTTHDRKLVDPSSPYISELLVDNGMSENDAVSLLHKISGCHGDSSKEIVSLVDRAPLSVASAGYYIKVERMRDSSYGFSDYLTGLKMGVVQSRSEELFSTQNRTYPVTMRAAVAMAARQLANDPNIVTVFIAMACCGESPVPMSLIGRILSVQSDSGVVLDAIKQCVLLQVSNESTGASNGIEQISLYQGTRETFQELFLDTKKGLSSVDMATDSNKNMIHHILDCLINEYESASSEETVQSYHLQHLLVSHLESFHKGHNLPPDFKPEPEQEVRLLHCLGEAYLLKGKPKEAKEVLEKALQMCEEDLGKGRTVFAAHIRNRLGNTYRHLGSLKESEFVLKESLAILEAERSVCSLDVAMVLLDLSSSLKSLGKYKESETCLRRSLKIYESYFGRKDHHVAVVLTSLGSILRTLGNSKESKNLFEESLNIQEEILDPFHPSIADTLSKLSTAYIDLGDPSTSIGLLKKALDINKHIHGPDHITVAITYSQLSNAHYHIGDMSKSAECARHALSLVQNSQGPLHFGVAVACGNLGSTYLDMGETKRARNLLDTSVSIVKRIYGEKHLQTSIGQTRLGNVMRLEGSLQGSSELLQTALKVKEDLLPKDHPSTTVTLIALGKALHELGNLTQSTKQLSRALGIQYNLYPLDHPQVIFTRADLARVLRDTGNLEQSAATMEEAIKTYEETQDGLGFTETHPKYASMLAINGLILRDIGSLYKSKSLLERALDIQERVLSRKNLMKAETLCNLGTVWDRLGNKSKANEFLKSSFDMLEESAVDGMHPMRATVLAAAGRLLIEEGELAGGQERLEDALKIRTAACGVYHPNVAYYHVLLRDVAGHDEESYSYHSKVAEDVYGFIIDRESLECIEAGVPVLPVVGVWKNLRGNL